MNERQPELAAAGSDASQDAGSSINPTQSVGPQPPIPRLVPGSSKALLAFGAGTTLMGLLLGFMIGASQSPVVSAALPLLFTFVVGAGGVRLVKTDLEDHKQIRVLKAAGLTLALFVSACLSGVWWGIEARNAHFTGSALASQLPLDDLSAEQALQLIALRQQLAVAGTSRDEGVSILNRAAADFPARKAGDTGNTNAADRLVAKLSAALEAAKSVMTKLPKSNDDKSPESVTLRAVAELYSALVRSILSVRLAETPTRGDVIKDLPVLDYIANAPESAAIALSAVSEAETQILSITLDADTTVHSTPNWTTYKAYRVTFEDAEGFKMYRPHYGLTTGDSPTDGGDRIIVLPTERLAPQRTR